MTVNDQDAELLSCEKYILGRVEHIKGIVGKKEKTETLGSKKKQFFVRFIASLRGVGAFFLYFNEAYKRKHYTASVFKNKIVLSDHASKLIQRKILAPVTLNHEKCFELQQLQSTFYIFFKRHRLLHFFKSFWRTKPASPAAVYELCNFWVYYTLYADWLFRSDLSAVLVVDDFSSKRLALILAAKDAGLRVGIVNMSDEPGRPFPFHGCEVLFCWNKEQASEKEGLWRLLSHLQRPVRPIKAITVDNNRQLCVGIAVNAFFDKNGLINLLKKLEALQWVDQIVIRFHPSTTPSELFSETEAIYFEVSDAGPELFFEKIDLLVCGRTSLIKDALLWGVPVAFDASLDVDRKVSYGYLTSGSIIDMTENQWDTDFIDRLNKFYQSNKWKKMRDQWFLPDPRAVSIKKALEYLLAVENEESII